jgi:hypothetical protein
VYAEDLTIYSIEAGVCSVSNPDAVDREGFSGKFNEHMNA